MFFLAQLAQFPGLLFAYSLVDRVGRIPVLRTSAFMTALVLGLYPLATPLLRLVLTGAFSFFIAPVFVVLTLYVPESYPTRLRASAVASNNVFINLPALFSSFVSEALVKAPQVWLYPVAFAGVFALCFVAACFLRTETADLSAPKKQADTQRTKVFSRADLHQDMAQARARAEDASPVPENLALVENSSWASW